MHTNHKPAHKSVHQCHHETGDRFRIKDDILQMISGTHKICWVGGWVREGANHGRYGAWAYNRGLKPGGLRGKVGDQGA